MGKISAQDRQVYKEKAQIYLSTIDSLIKNEKKLLLTASKSASQAPMIKLTIANEVLNLISNYIAVNGVSWAVLQTKNEEALNDGRKALYKAVIYLEGIVSDYIDAPFSDYEDKLALIASFDANKRYHLVRKMGIAIDMLRFAYGDNSKWRWTFVELEGRFAVIAKNIIDLRSVYVNSSMESPYYAATTFHIQLIKKLLTQSADRYREKYEMSSAQPFDFKTGITFLTALRRIHITLGEPAESENIKRKIAIWTAKYDSDVKKQETEKKKS